MELNRFKDKYTTNEKINIEEKDEKVKEKVEKSKTILSNDAYAMGEVFEKSIELMGKQIAAVMRGMVK